MHSIHGMSGEASILGTDGTVPLQGDRRPGRLCEVNFCIFCKNVCVVCCPRIKIPPINMDFP